MASIFEVIGGLFDITKDFVDEVVDLSKSTGESLRHLDDDNYKTSYDIRDEARKIIRDADSKWYRKTELFERKLSMVEMTINENNDRKGNLLSAISRKSVTGGLSNLRDVNVPAFRARDDFNFGSLLGVFGDSMRKAAANEYLEDAKQYRTMINSKIAQLERVEGNLDLLLQKMKEEKEILSILEMGVKKNITKDKEIANSLQLIIDTYICNKDGSINEKYIVELEKLKRISERI